MTASAQTITNQPSSLPQVITKFHTFFAENKDKEELILYGGSGGSKSHSVCQHLVEELFTIDDIQILVTRKTRPSLKATTWKMVRGILSDFNYVPGRDYEINKTDLVIDAKNGNQMLFTGLDDPQKIKSSSYNRVYVEEITEFTPEDYFFIKNTLRRPTKSKVVPQRILTFNPVDVNHWVWQDIVLKPSDNQAVIHSTHWDNPFLPDSYRRELEELISANKNLYKVYTLGEPGVLENIIYSNYHVIQFPAKTYSKDIFFGLDFGFNNPSALVEIHVKDDGLYIREPLHESGLTTSDLIERIKPIVGNKLVYADSAEPDRIAEMKRAGLNVFPAKKDVIDGIDHVKRYKLYIDSESVDLIGEIRGYCYREDRDGHVLEEPVKFRDHAMDALRYGIHTHLGKPAGRARIGSGVTRGW